MRRTLLAAGFSWTLLSFTIADYVWPSRYDSIDDLLYLQSGYIRNGALADQVLSCEFGAGQPGIQKSAEWIRTAFHDAITHDASTKTGGLDASIQFELDRRENLGAALNNTLADISSSYDLRTSAADLLALSLVMAVARCGNLYVPLRLGRKDATDEGIMGVPEAFTDVDTTEKRFATAGLSKEEMITLVACGHTVGGVHSVDHPEIVTEGGVSAENVARFDNTTGKFDNAVVTEFLDNTTKNPLIVAKNDTLNSDKRIFTSDGNSTMEKLRDPNVYKAQCEAVMEKMLDLVPGEVTLTEPLEPADVKPYIESYQFKGDAVELAGRIRVRVSEVTGRNATDLVVSLIPISLNGAKDLPEIPTSAATFRGGSSFGYLQESLQWFEFNQTFSNGTIKGFDVKLTTKSTNVSTILDNGGADGFPLNPDLLFHESESCTTYDSSTETGQLNVRAAIRKEVADGASPKITVVHRNPVGRSFLPRLSQETVEMERTQEEMGDFVVYRGSVGLLRTDVSGTRFDIEAGDSKIEYINTGGLGENVCSTW